MCNVIMAAEDDGVMMESNYDKALYFKYKNGKLNQVAAFHVDDLLNIEIEKEGLLDFLSQKLTTTEASR